MVVVETVNTFVTETVDTAEGVAYLNAAHIVFIIVVEVAVKAREHAGIHLGNLVDVLCDVELTENLEVGGNLDTFGGEVQFPTFVLHVTYVTPCKRVETGRRRNTYILHQKVFSVLVVNVQLEREQVFEQTEVET